MVAIPVAPCGAQTDLVIGGVNRGTTFVQPLSAKTGDLAQWPGYPNRRSRISFRSSEGAVQLRYLRDAVLVAPEDLAGGFASKRAAANANGLRWRAVDWCGGQDLACLPALRRFAACGPDDRSHQPA
ncbi:hypothetical protein, partial [Mesorhizobium sp. M1A.F.Ca.IN.022.02.1.1]|uniref:hypothetical protein n=5 Tax=unclassified Mesorhizobium TaxID=325217 RepID=UPI0019D2886B